MVTRVGLSAGGLTVEAVAKALQDKFPAGVVVTKQAQRRVYVRVDKDVLYRVCEVLKNELSFEHVSCVTGVDRKDRFQVVHHISSYANRIVIEITVDLPHDAPEIDSITPLWGGANWHERETYDLFGIVFKNHPRLERILTPEGTDFFPFRKDFVYGRRV
jgi:NADH-quinone oxidoreductase subunit C